MVAVARNCPCRNGLGGMRHATATTMKTWMRGEQAGVVLCQPLILFNPPRFWGGPPLSPRCADNSVSTEDLARSNRCRLVSAGHNPHQEIDAAIRRPCPLQLENPVFKGLRSDRADKLWLPKQVAAFTAVASPEMYAAMMLGMHTGQRQGDLRRLVWSATTASGLPWQGKGGKVVSIRCTAALRELVDGMDRRSLLILTTPTGRAWTKRYFNDHWFETENAADITDVPDQPMKQGAQPPASRVRPAGLPHNRGV